MAEVKLPLNVRKDIRDYEPKRDAALADIAKTTGKQFTCVPNFEYVFSIFFSFFFLFYNIFQHFHLSFFQYKYYTYIRIPYPFNLTYFQYRSYVFVLLLFNKY